jgi:steroid delta-isomerase-like uncharacterized protein
MAIASPPTGVSNAELVRWIFGALNRRDLDALRRLWTAEAVVRFPDRTCRGTEEIAAYFEEAFAGIPDWDMEPLAIVEQGDDVFAHWRLRGTHGGPLLGIQATGKRLEIDGMDHFVVRDGRIVSNFVVFDQMQYAREIGMLPPDGSAGDKALKAAFNARTKVAGRVAELQARRTTS